MGELEARALRGPGRTLAIDEPYQHYQFAGRADVLAWDRENLLHIENRTRFPNLQEAAGSYNAKRQYLAGGIADRAGIGPRGWRSVTHVMACLWSAEVLHAIRLRRASFDALCPDPPDALLAWLTGEQPAAGVTSTLVVLDPLVPFGSRRRTIAAVGPADEPPRLNPRFRGYADAAEALRQAGRTTGNPIARAASASGRRRSRTRRGPAERDRESPGGSRPASAESAAAGRPRDRDGVTELVHLDVGDDAFAVEPDHDRDVTDAHGLHHPDTAGHQSFCLDIPAQSGP